MSDSTPPTKRAALPWPVWRRLLREVAIWPLDLDDGTGDGSPSLTKLLALLYALLGVHVIVEQIPVSGTQLTLVIIAISCAFGRSVWKLWLSRGTWSFGASDTTSRAEVTTRTLIEQVQARRDPAQGYEVSR